MVFSSLAVWDDAEARIGSDNMAVDQFLLECGYSLPILRVYDWSQPTVSLGYFHPLQDAWEAFPIDEGEELRFVRRWTGGGIVDHRVDITYTLVIPRNEDLAKTRGAESYRAIHQALADVLNEMGESVLLEKGGVNARGGECFANPVLYDLCDSSGRKVAGAGQRRTRHGLLHQGSVMPVMDRELIRSQFPHLLAQYLAESCTVFKPNDLLSERISGISASRYANKDWLQRR